MKAILMLFISAAMLVFSSTVLGQTNAPTTVTSPAPQSISNQWQVTLPPTNAGSVFYRLIQ